MKALVVDDSVTMRKMLVQFLLQVGIDDCVMAIDGKDALVKLSENSDVDLILCDWNMPNMSGMELLTTIRKSANKSEKKFIMVTSEGDQMHVVEAIKGGANNYIIKPFNPAEVIKKIESVINT